MVKAIGSRSMSQGKGASLREDGENDKQKKGDERYEEQDKVKEKRALS